MEVVISEGGGGLTVLPHRPPGLQLPPVSLFCRQGGTVGGLEGVVLQCWKTRVAPPLGEWACPREG